MVRYKSLINLLIVILLFNCNIIDVKGQAPEMYNMEWRGIGPAHFGGRVTSVIGLPGDYKTYFVGTAAGGLFRTKNGGTTFNSVFDETGSPSIGAVAISSSDNRIIYVGTGEGDPRNDISFGDGIYRSDNGGDNWRHIGLDGTERFSAIVVHPENPNIVYAAAMGKAWSANKERGVFKSVDGGKTWDKILFVNNTTGSSSISLHPEDPSIIYAGMYDYLRKPWHFRSGGTGSGLYKSVDAGRTWTQLTDPLLNNGLPGKKLIGRIDVDISISNPEIIYAMIESEEDGELWRSDNGGNTWVMVSDNQLINNRPFYYTTLFVSPDNAFNVWALAGSLYLSENGGKDFSRNMGSTFGDHHAFWIDPEDPDHLLNGCDGGVSVSYDRGRNWNFLNNIPMAQAFHVGYDMQYPYNVYSGFQDHEIWKGPSQRWAETGATGKDWTRLRDMADGMYAFAHPADNNIIIYSGHFGDITKADLRTGEERFIQPYPIGPSETSAAYEKYRFHWDSPVVLSPHDPEVLYYGGNVIFRSQDRGETWTVISPDLTTNNPEKMKLSGGPISPDNTRAEYHCTIVSIAESPLKKGLIIAGTDDGNLQISHDNGKSWINFREHLPGPDNGWISEVEASASDTNRIYISIDQHRLGDFNSYLFKSEDMGLTWENITDGLKSYVHCIIEDPINTNLLFAGTERGVFVSYNAGAKWHSLNNGIPVLPVRDLQIHPRENDLIIATHGRGLFIMDDISWMREISGKSNESPSLLNTRNAHRYIPVSDRSTQGDDIYIAPNPDYGAIINYYIPDEYNDAGLDIVVSSSNNTTLWEFKADTQTGVHRITWNLGEDLSLVNENIETDRYAGRLKLPPGSYYVSLVDKYGTNLDRKELEILPDPRNEIPPENTIKCYELVHNLSISMNHLRTILDEMEKVTDYIKTRYKGVEVSDLIKNVEELRSRIKPERLSPDGYNILYRMNWLFNQVRKNSDKPTLAQQKWIEYLIKQAELVTVEWEELSDSINSRK
jgi:photosystem II stability/assembly factor-like uncharacterized protein